MASLRIIGIDPGSRITGWGIIESNGFKSRYVDCGCLRLSDASLPVRLGEIFTGVSELIQQYQPDVMAIEDVFMSKNAASALKLGQARGAAICSAVATGMDVSEYSPRRVKQAVSGFGAADKSQVQNMVCLLLNLNIKLQADAADGLAIAITHAHGGGFNTASFNRHRKQA